MLTAIESRRKLSEERAAAIERGELTLHDPREKRERELKAGLLAQVRTPMAPDVPESERTNAVQFV